MFERLELRFEETEGNWMIHSFDIDISNFRNFVKGSVNIAYDSIENKTYCYYSDFSIAKGKREFNFVLEGKTLVEELENTDFRNWSPVHWYDRGTDIEWTIEYNDKNKPSKYINHDCDVPKEFHNFIMIIDKYFNNAHLTKLKELQYDGNFQETMDFIVHHNTDWPINGKVLNHLKKLTTFIKLFENQTFFGKWEPSENTSDFYSSDNHFIYSEDVNKFRNIIQSIEKLLHNSYGVCDLQLLPEIDELKEKSNEYLIDNRMAIMFLIKFWYEYFYSESSTSYKVVKALKDGTILLILNFIKEYNHF